MTEHWINSSTTKFKRKWIISWKFFAKRLGYGPSEEAYWGHRTLLTIAGRRVISGSCEGTIDATTKNSEKRFLAPIWLSDRLDATLSLRPCRSGDRCSDKGICVGVGAGFSIAARQFDCSTNSSSSIRTGQSISQRPAAAEPLPVGTTSGRDRRIP